MQNRKLCLVSALIALSGLAGLGQDLNKTNLTGMNKVCFYLLKERPHSFSDAITNLNNMALEESPWFTSDDIVHYDIEKHVFVLKTNLDKRLRHTSVPVEGIPFMVMVGKRRVFVGLFTSSASSLVYDAPTIEQPSASGQKEFAILPSPRIEKRANTWIYHLGPPPNTSDPRNDPEVLEIMRSRGRPDERK